MVRLLDREAEVKRVIRPMLPRRILSRDRQVWLREYPFPGVDEDQRWLVLEPDGTPVAWVSVPRHFRPWEFGEDYLLGVGRDELDVQYVQRYRLVPGTN